MKFKRKFALILATAFVLLAVRPVDTFAATNNTSYGVVVLGDSRTEYLNYYATKLPNEFFVYGYGMGYDWMMIIGIPQVQQIIAAHPEYTRWKIVNFMGYNDASRVNEYLAAYQNLNATTFAGYETYYLSLTSCQDQLLYDSNLRNGIAPENMHNTWNASVIAYNQLLYATFPTKYIDAYNPMLAAGFIPEDGVHYNSAAANNYLMNIIRAGIGN